MSGRVLEGMTYENYVTVEGENWTNLKHARKSMLEYHFQKTAPRKETTSLGTGKATHTAAFEPRRFPDEYVIQAPGPITNEFHKGRVEGKAAWATWLEAHPNDTDLDGDAWRTKAFREANPGKTFLTRTQYETAWNIGERLRAHPDTSPYLLRGRGEVGIQWTDEETGIVCKSRLDWITGKDLDNPETICELKTARSIEPFKFQRQAEGFGYFHQVAFQRRGFMAVWPGAPPAIRWLVAENAGALDVGSIRVSADALESADNEISGLLLKLKGCRASGRWPGIYTEEREMNRPDYANRGPQDQEAPTDGPITY